MEDLARLMTVCQRSDGSGKWRKSHHKLHCEHYGHAGRQLGDIHQHKYTLNMISRKWTRTETHTRIGLQEQHENHKKRLQIYEYAATLT